MVGNEPEHSELVSHHQGFWCQEIDRDPSSGMEKDFLDQNAHQSETQLIDIITYYPVTVFGTFPAAIIQLKFWKIWPILSFMQPCVSEPVISPQEILDEKTP